jgi:hypothetical protein
MSYISLGYVINFRPVCSIPKNFTKQWFYLFETVKPEFIDHVLR